MTEAMTDSSYHRYPKEGLTGEYIRAGVGTAFFGAPFVFADLGAVMLVIFGSLTAFFLGYGARTLGQQLSVIELNPQGLVRHGPLARRIAWDALDRVSLRYFTTAKDRPRGDAAGGGRGANDGMGSGRGAGASHFGSGWMEMTVAGGGARLKIDSNIEGFNALAGAVERAALQRQLNFDDSTEANFRALRGHIEPDDYDDPRDKTPYDDKYRGPGI
jgi:hypothetical protein